MYNIQFDILSVQFLTKIISKAMYFMKWNNGIITFSNFVTYYRSHAICNTRTAFNRISKLNHYIADDPMIKRYEYTKIDNIFMLWLVLKKQIWFQHHVLPGVMLKINDCDSCCYLCLLTFVIQYLLTTDQQEKQLRLYEIIIVTPHTP